MRKSDFLLTIFASVLAVQVAHAEANEPDPKSGRSKQIHFEDSVVEGMNQNTKGSLDTTGKKDRGDRPHLYKKRENYQAEILELSRELGQLP